jgi:hypothetical protein
MPRLPALAILRSRKTPIEQYQYLSVLRTTNVNLFYRLVSANIKVCLFVRCNACNE